MKEFIDLFVKLIQGDEGGIYLLVVSIIAFVFFVLSIIRVIIVAYKKKDCRLEYNAEIVDFIKVQARYGIHYVPIYEYEYEGIKYKYKSKWQIYYDKSKQNETVTLYINPEFPSRACENEDFKISTTIILSVIAVIVFSMIFAIYLMG